MNSNIMEIENFLSRFQFNSTDSKEYDNETVSRLISEVIKDMPLDLEPKGLYEPIRYTMDTGGKRLRPTLMLNAVAALGGNVMEAVGPAVGLEMFHNFTLLHDDIMDGADLRRGHPTVHRKWNVNTAILSGDAMLTLAGSLVTLAPDYSLRPVLETYHTTAMQVYEGQQLDMEYEHAPQVSIEQYIHMIRLKTAVLIGCACKMGALIARAPHATCQAFYDYGIALGLGFQLQDDRLDIYGDPLLFGKQIGGDILNRKKTWLLISALERDNDGHLAHLLEGNMTDAKLVEAVRCEYDKHNLNALASSEINKYANQALQALEKIEMPTHFKKYFTDLAHNLSVRDN